MTRRRCAGVNVDSTERRAMKALLLARDGGSCCWCDAPFSVVLPPTFEHATPWSRGGSNRLGNLLLACGPCNTARGDRLGPPPFVTAAAMGGAS